MAKPTRSGPQPFSTSTAIREKYAARIYATGDAELKRARACSSELEIHGHAVPQGLTDEDIENLA